MPGLIGKKIGMTSVFGADGKNIPCTVIEAGPCVVTQLRTVEKDGYAAVQLAYDEIKEIHASAPLMGHFKKAGTTPKRKLIEFEADFEGDLKLGDTVTVADIVKDDVKFVDVVGTSKGRGFQGVVHRYHFAGVGGATHGQHNRLRKPGSLGASSWPSRVFPGAWVDTWATKESRCSTLRLLRLFLRTIFSSLRVPFLEPRVLILH